VGVVEGLPEFLTLGVLAGLLVGVDAFASDGLEGEELAVEQLSLCRNPRVSD
jgi:hypothetical protein